MYANTTNLVRSDDTSMVASMGVGAAAGAGAGATFLGIGAIPGAVIGTINAAIMTGIHNSVDKSIE